MSHVTRPVSFMHHKVSAIRRETQRSTITRDPYLGKGRSERVKDGFVRPRSILLGKGTRTLSLFAAAIANARRRYCSRFARRQRGLLSLDRGCGCGCDYGDGGGGGHDDDDVGNGGIRTGLKSRRYLPLAAVTSFNSYQFHGHTSLRG